MADPRFFDNRGPFSSSVLCEHLQIPSPDSGGMIHDVAGLKEAGPPHLSFFEGQRARTEFANTKAGWCLVANDFDVKADGPVALRCKSVGHAFAKAATLFYPDHNVDVEAQDQAIHPTARLGQGVVVGSGVVIGANAEIGDRTRLGPGCVIGHGVTIGTDCQINASAWIGFSYLGDGVRIGPGTRIGTPGFGFVSSKSGHTRLPQLGRAIIQDRVEIGANTAIDRGALGDTVIGEGTKIDNLVHIGHNTVIGRHCIIAGKVGMAGSARLGDFVFIGGMAGVGDHAVIGDGARIAAMAGVWGELKGGQDYGGMKARPVREWQREMLVLSKLAKDWKRSKDE